MILSVKISYLVLQMSSLLMPLLQLVKTGFTKAVQRLDGIFALLCVAKIVAVDVKAGAVHTNICTSHTYLHKSHLCIIIYYSSPLYVDFKIFNLYFV